MATNFGNIRVAPTWAGALQQTSRTTEWMASLLLGDLNDYIQPSVACLKPLTGGYEAKQPLAENSPVLANLNDCLACSGCITSAETVLVTEQTRQQLYDILAHNAQAPQDLQKIVIVSLCSASRTALCKFYGEASSLSVFRRLQHFFVTVLGAYMLFDTTFGYNFSLRAAAKEFVQRYQSGQVCGQTMKTLLSSECPGWVCYAEKKQPHMLEQICTVRSPQQIMGTLVKSYLAEQLASKLGRSIGRGDIFHVSIQACYDKKLEAAREDFADKDHVRDVDCVIATNELIRMIEERGPEGGFLSIPESPLPTDSPFPTWYQNAMGQFCLQKHPGSSAGGYLAYILSYAADTLFGIRLAEDIRKDSRVTFGYHRSNIDYVEVTLRSSAEDPKNSPVLLRFAAIYGFRNIQTFVQKAKARRVDYQFVELMACPGACLFGGGQPPLSEANGITIKAGGGSVVNKATQEAHRQEMERLWEALDSWSPLHLPHREVERIWAWIEADQEKRRPLLYTSYHALENRVVERKNPLITVQW